MNTEVIIMNDTNEVKREAINSTQSTPTNEVSEENEERVDSLAATRRQRTVRHAVNRLLLNVSSACVKVATKVSTKAVQHTTPHTVIHAVGKFEQQYNLIT